MNCQYFLLQFFTQFLAHNIDYNENKKYDIDRFWNIINMIFRLIRMNWKFLDIYDGQGKSVARLGKLDVK